MDDGSIDDLRSRDPGTDPEDPYDGVDVDSLPEWWRRAIEEFDAHGLRPYRPPRFEDGSFTHEVLAPLEREYGVDIQFTSVDTDYRERWAVRVDGTTVGTVGRYRSTGGYTVYTLDPDEFESLVLAALDDG